MYLVLFSPVVDGVAISRLERVRAGGVGAAALPLQPGRPVGVQLAAHGVGRTDGQLRLRTLQSKMLCIIYNTHLFF